MPYQKTDLTLGIANIAAGVSAGSGVLTFMNENAGALGVIISLATLTTAMIFYIMNYKLRILELKVNREELRDEVIDEVLSHLAIKSNIDSHSIKESLKDRRHTGH